MSDIIQLLPDHVANQIAAGEVVQRPASVVKELLENAIDADATEVQLIVNEAGRNLVQVTDNGKGMSATDARMAFERHATSKIKTTEDIFSILTKGFRGEALASIAAVAEVELRSKKVGDEFGTSIMINGGEFVSQEPVSCAQGSNFMVKNLFYNVPARRKFLKGNNVEYRHILDEFHRVALAHEQIEMQLFHQDENVYKLRAGRKIQRIIEIFGRKLEPNLVPITEDLEWIKVTGYVGKPASAKKNRNEQFFFVNNRFFKSPYLAKAVIDAYAGLLPPGTHPSFFLYIEVSPDMIDVNIHPQKTEVKFEDEHLIYALLRSSIKRSLGIYNISPSIDFDRNITDAELFKDDKTAMPKPTSSNPSVDRTFNPFEDDKHWQAPTYNPKEGAELQKIYATPSTSASKINLFEDDDDELDNDQIIKLPNAYWLYQQYDKVFVLDLGRIHKTILMAKTQNQNQEIKKQNLLFCIDLYLDDLELELLKGISEALKSKGFDFIFDDSEMHINAVPESLTPQQATSMVQYILSEMMDLQPENFEQVYQSQSLKVQGKTKFDFHHKHEVLELIKQFNDLGFPAYSPDNKVNYTLLDLEAIKGGF